MNLILLEENRENEMIRIETQKMIIQKLLDNAIKKRNFNMRDLVLRKALGNKVDCSAGKLEPTQERPCRILGLTLGEIYNLEDMERKKEDLSQNANHLRKYYI